MTPETWDILSQVGSTMYLEASSALLYYPLSHTIPPVLLLWLALRGARIRAARTEPAISLVPLLAALMRCAVTCLCLSVLVGVGVATSMALAGWRFDSAAGALADAASIVFSASLLTVLAVGWECRYEPTILYALKEGGHPFRRICVGGRGRATGRSRKANRSCATEHSRRTARRAPVPAAHPAANRLERIVAASDGPAFSALVVAAAWMASLLPSLFPEVSYWVENLSHALRDNTLLGSPRGSIFYYSMTGCLYGMFVSGVLGYALPLVLALRLPRRVLRTGRSPREERVLAGVRDAALVNLCVTSVLPLALEAGSFFFPLPVLDVLFDAHIYSVLVPACQMVFAASLLTALVFAWGHWEPTHRDGLPLRIAGALLFELAIWIVPLAFHFAYATWIGTF